MFDFHACMHFYERRQIIQRPKAESFHPVSSWSTVNFNPSSWYYTTKTTKLLHNFVILTISYVYAIFRCFCQLTKSFVYDLVYQTKCYHVDSVQLLILSFLELLLMILKLLSPAFNRSIF